MYAMNRMATIYAELADGSADDLAFQDEDGLNQLYALRESTDSMQITAAAWSTASIAAGQTTADDTIAVVGPRGLTPEERLEACDLAKSLYDGLNDERQVMGLGPFDTTPAPFLVDSSVFGPLADCPNDFAELPDTGNCALIEVENAAGAIGAPAGESGSLSLWYCGNAY